MPHVMPHARMPHVSALCPLCPTFDTSHYALNYAGIINASLLLGTNYGRGWTHLVGVCGMPAWYGAGRDGTHRNFPCYLGTKYLLYLVMGPAPVHSPDTWHAYLANAGKPSTSGCYMHKSHVSPFFSSDIDGATGSRR